MSDVESPSDAAVMVQGLQKSYGDVVAIRDLSLTISAGSVCAVVGPVRSGKTTLLRTMATLDSPDAGSIRVCGKDTRRDAGEVRRKIGFMPAEFGRYRDLTAEEYLKLYADAYLLPRSQKELVIEELLELVDLADRRDQHVETLPPAAKQWLGLARCLIHDPEVLLLDEPMQGMDPTAHGEFWQTLRELSELEKTVILTVDAIDDAGSGWSQIVHLDKPDLSDTSS
jgi:ABC-2 type transport system ATP-binding protein